MFYESYLEQEPDLVYESAEDLEDLEDEYRQDRNEELANRFSGY